MKPMLANAARAVTYLRVRFTFSSPLSLRKGRGVPLPLRRPGECGRTMPVRALLVD
jgi:hypothetical protein